MRHYVKEWREHLGLTQEEVARRLGLEHKSSVNKIEKNPEKNLSMARAGQLARVFDLSSPQDLFKIPSKINQMLTKDTQTPLSGASDPQTGGPFMQQHEFALWMKEAADIPPEYAPVARQALKAILTALAVRPESHPQKRARGE